MTVDDLTVVAVITALNCAGFLLGFCCALAFYETKRRR
jgi:hypothetical protein